MSSHDAMPPALPAMWRTLRRAHDAEPGLLSASFGLALLAALPDALIALWFKVLADGVLEHRRGLAVAAAVGLGVSAAATWFLKIVSDRVQRRFRDRVAVALEAHVAGLQASVATIAHHERPEYIDRLAMLRNQVFVLDHIYMSIFSTCGWLLRLGVTLALLGSIHPVLLLLAVFALPTVGTSTWRPRVERTVEEGVTSANRLARHLFTTATTSRLSAAGSSLLRSKIVKYGFLGLAGYLVVAHPGAYNAALASLAEATGIPVPLMQIAGWTLVLLIPMYFLALFIGPTAEWILVPALRRTCRLLNPAFSEKASEGSPV